MQRGQRVYSRKLPRRRPDNPQYRYHLAQALNRTGEKERAKQILQELLADNRLESDHAKIRTILQEFGN